MSTDAAPPGAFVSAPSSPAAAAGATDLPAPAPAAAATSDPVPDTVDANAHANPPKPEPASSNAAAPNTPADAAPSQRADTEAPAPAVPAAVPEAEAVTPSDTKGKRKAPPAGLQLHDVPAAETRSIEIDQGHASQARSRTSTLSQPFTPSRHHAPDSPTTSLIGTLRSQLEMYVQQTEQLNAKLVASIGRHADLEDQVFALQTDSDRMARDNKELARSKAQWEESMNTGLLVERSVIRDEMQRLAAGLVEEERKRGTAEEKRKQVEDEVDELSATLFDQANTMVATERMARAQAEQRLKDTEDSLAAAEAAVRDMQTHMQNLTTMVSTGPSAPSIPRRYLSSHPPYAEFRTLITHLRAARPSALSRKRADVREIYPAPLVASLVQQPFIARCIAEDYDPTLRLENAADLGWVSRRSVSSAILAGDLLIEPVGSAAFGPPETLSCALCGRLVFGGGASQKGLMKYFSNTGGSGSHSHLSSNIYVFRVATQEDAKSYPLCKNGWCLERLRAACALWHFVRTGIVDPVWFGRDQDATPATPKAEGTAATAADEGTPVRIDLNRTPPDADKLTISPAIGQQRSVSAPVTGPVAITVENLASAEYRRPAAPPQRKSGWGLGSFGLGSGGKSSGGGWSSWGSRPTTPAPASPAASITTIPDQRSVSAGVLGAPIALDGEKEAAVEKKVEPVVGKVDVPPVSEKEPIVEAVVVDEKAALAADDKLAAQPADVPTSPLPRSDSRTSHRSHASSTDHSFATPTGDHASLPDVNGGANGEDKTEGSNGSTEVPTATASPVKQPELQIQPDGAPSSPPKTAPGSPSKPGTPVNGSSASPTRPSRAAGRQPPPAPPLPKRSERRGLGTPTPPITPTAPTDPAKSPDTPKTGAETPTSRTTPGPPVMAKPEATATPGAALEDTPLVDTAASAAAAAAEAPNTPVSAGAEADASTPTASSTSPSRIPPPRHPLAIMRSPVSSPRASVDGNAGQAQATPPLPPPRHKASTERSVSVSSTSSYASNASDASSASHATAAPDHDASAGSDGRSFLTGEGWEARAWRQVVRLKEDMWRARVGVVDDDE